MKIKEAKQELIRLSDNDKERERFKKRFESLLEQNSLLSNAERKGIQKGENKKAIEIAKNLLDILDNETISLKTGLPINEINKLRK
ncbi:MAG: hypothetical protein SOR73_10845 [Romboutsia timonensis]|uniref:hypothetical protein n=1 Tax=Romboutsia timonensis TaxID=1776391 RepID=UPI002A756A60|nr:hypothetical protein [Romboutsia timonensis]MDY3002146.1 hypothetical protein [Romboutsia timonensis]